MKKILVVDDTEDIRESTKDVLEPRGYKIILAKDGDECLKLAKTENPDLILMDLLMPGTPVDKVLRKLKKFKVIIFSVVSLEEKYVAETGKKFPTKKKFLNVVDSIRKPLNLDELLFKIKKALE